MSGPSGRRRPPVRTVALRGGEGRRSGSSRPRASSAISSPRSGRCPSCAACSRTRELDPEERAAALDEILGGADELIRNFLRLLSEKGRTAQIDEIYREFEELVAAEQKRLTVELTTAYELSDDEAATILKKIEKSSGRSVEATRKVDPL